VRSTPIQTQFPASIVVAIAVILKDSMTQNTCPDHAVGQYKNIERSNENVDEKLHFHGILQRLGYQQLKVVEEVFSKLRKEKYDNMDCTSTALLFAMRSLTPLGVGRDSCKAFSEQGRLPFQ
jgi:hypothetical protein